MNAGAAQDSAENAVHESADPADAGVAQDSADPAAARDSAEAAAVQDSAGFPLTLDATRTGWTGARLRIRWTGNRIRRAGKRPARTFGYSIRHDAPPYAGGHATPVTATT